MILGPYSHEENPYYQNHEKTGVLVFLGLYICDVVCMLLYVNVGNTRPSIYSTTRTHTYAYILTVSIYIIYYCTKTENTSESYSYIPHRSLPVARSP